MLYFSSGAPSAQTLGVLMSIIVPDYVPYLLAILALLFVWQIYQMQIVAGRVEAKNFWDRSGIRLFIHVTPEDEQTCPACQEANGLAVLPATAVKTNFTPASRDSCTNPAGCRCQLIGLHCSWPQAHRLLSQTMAVRPKGVKLSDEKFEALLRSSREQPPGKTKEDRVAIYMLEAVRAEGRDAGTAVKQYRKVVDEAKTARDLPLVLPAYLRMLDLLERSERPKEALELIDRFEKEYLEETNGPHGPTPAQREMLSLRKTRLTATLQRSY